MTDFNTFTFGFIGLGLIGGSIAKAIRKYYPNARIVSYNPSRDTLEEAFSDGVINRGICRERLQQKAAGDGTQKSEEGPLVSGKDSPAADAAGAVGFSLDHADQETVYRRLPEDVPASRADLQDMLAACDVIFLCAPVQKNAENLALIRGHLKDNAILTDIGSTKRDIHQHVVAEGLQRYFIGGHPMTGSERTRYHNSKAELLENAYYLLAPEPEAGQEKACLFYDLVRSLKAIPLLTNCDFHDYAVAGISHVPHVVSASLVNLVRESDNADGIMKTIAAGGFRDITRISSSSPEMWRQICLTNGDNILRLLDDYVRILKKAEDAIEDKDPERIYEFFASAKKYRDSFETVNSGATNRLWLLHVDIEDRPASLAEVVTLLAVNSVSIKNIGITHNREFQEGVLRVEFYNEDDLKEAMEILTTRNYTVYTAN